MAGEVIFVLMMFGFFIFALFAMSKNKREMTPNERLAYEQERGRQQAMREARQGRW